MRVSSQDLTDLAALVMLPLALLDGRKRLAAA
jgi:hypothetical protein